MKTKTSFIDIDISNKLYKFKKKNNLTYPTFFKLAFDDFKNSLKKNQKIILKENYYERLKIRSIAVKMLDDDYNMLQNLAVKNNINIRLLIREIMTRFIKKQKNL